VAAANGVGVFLGTLERAQIFLLLAPVQIAGEKSRASVAVAPVE
jgi:hypothetical protein